MEEEYIWNFVRISIRPVYSCSKRWATRLPCYVAFTHTFLCSFQAEAWQLAQQ